MSSAHLKNTSHHIFSKLSMPKTTKIYDTYWRFAAERQNIFFKRIAGAEWPWTNDPILKEYKFTNAYRASDRVSQYLIHNVIYQGDQNPEEVFFRILLFKIFNKIETWQLLQQELGEISYADYSFKIYNSILTRAFKAKKRIYSAAYIMASGRSKFGFNRKHANHLKLIELMMRDSIPERITELKSLQALFELLRSYPTLGDFLAYQYAIDLNYSNMTNFSEMEFIIPGPGALDGIQKCFSDYGAYSPSDIIRLVTEHQNEAFEKREIIFKSLWGRLLQLIDCQNLFCEVDKYSRVAHPDVKGISGRTKIKQRFKMHSQKVDVWYPPKWGLKII